MSEAEFFVGDLVCVRSDPERKGSIMAILDPVRGKTRYRVFHSLEDIREYASDQIQSIALPQTAEDLNQALATQVWVPNPEFQARLTASRLSHPLTDNLYALYAARIKHIPFQFKPMLKVIRSDRPRILIADEVGVGKTIEAGLIMKELETRQELRNVMVLCPKALVLKWQDEMRRFDEDFRIMSPETLRYTLRETDLDGIWPPQYSRIITNLELLRIEKYMYGTTGRTPRPGMMALEPPPKFDLLIVDEAHHLRNPGTKSFELARYLCEISEAVLFLTATPVHIGSVNLYNLLSLLRPDQFPDRNVFDEMVEPNKFITQAMRSVRYYHDDPNWKETAAETLKQINTTTWGRRVIAQDPVYQDSLELLQIPEEMENYKRVRLLRELEDLHSLAHIVNRTRRRDIGKFTLREPHTVSTEFTEGQKSFYSTLINFRQQVLSQEYESGVVKLITDTLQRQAASCIPGLLPYLDAFISSGTFSGKALTDAPELDEVEEEIPDYVQELTQELRDQAAQLTDDDPKLENLNAIIDQTLQRDGPGKVLLFSFFLHTLRYLESQLLARGLRVGLVTGKVNHEDREILRDRFRLPRENPEAIDVLLSSEVGCEGLDYEFCDCLVNYDIPWNPMRIEQRIGRIDRFGQKAKKVLIFNFITPGTVEDRIFFRCFERLGIFKETLGDMEEVLGDLVADLTKIALDPDLTFEQAVESAQQEADNVIRLVNEERKLEEESEGSVSLGKSFTKEVDALIKDNKYVAPVEIQQMVDQFVRSPDLEGDISPVDKKPGVYWLRMRQESREQLYQMVDDRTDYQFLRTKFARWLRDNNPRLEITFSQEAAIEHREVSFITPIHPLAKLAVGYWVRKNDPLVSNLLIRDNTIAPGSYVFICDLWESIGVKP